MDCPFLFTKKQMPGACEAVIVMNRTHRIVINRRTGARQAVSETAKSSGFGGALAISAALLTAALSPAAHAVDWAGNTGSWLDATNWLGGVPTSADDVEIYGPGTALVSGNGSNAQGHYVSIGRGAPGSLSVTSGGKLSITKTFVGDIGSSTVLVDGTNSLLSTGGLVLGTAGQGALTVSNGGTLRTGSIEIGLQPGGQGTLNLNAGGTVETGSIYGLVGPNPGATGIFNWSGGTLRVIGSELVSAMDATLSGSGSTIDTNG